MTNALIIDDEARNRKTLELMLRESFPELDISQADGVKSGLESIKKINPQIVFLDIEMPDGSGFDLLRKAQNFNFELIFTTAHNEYALQAFKVSAIGYLLKPIDENELRAAVQKALNLLKTKQGSREEQFKALLGNYSNILGKVPRLMIPDDTGFQVLDIEKIVYLEGDGNYSYVYMTDSKYHSSHNLGWYENVLLNQSFFRISKSHLVNLKYATSYSHKDGGTIIMNGKLPLSVSDNKKEELRKRFL